LDADEPHAYSATLGYRLYSPPKNGGRACITMHQERHRKQFAAST